jgi:dTDP-L-rhamnose 4-epimerase
MKGKVLITGGAGFIGTHLTRRLFRQGYQVVIFDNLSPQIHGGKMDFDEDLKKSANCIFGNISDPQSYNKLPLDFDYVFHLASETGTGQSMYSISKYTEVNIQGTALLLEFLSGSKTPIRKLILSSSRAIYGEGAYHCVNHGLVFPEGRDIDNMSLGKFELNCPVCQKKLSLVPTAEDSLFKPLSVYGISKLSQELLLMQSAKSFGIPSVALRFQNVYGPGQSLSNPYTGILSIFSTRIRHSSDIDIFEDGEESRDFVFIDDVVDSLILALEKGNVYDEAINIGGGQSTSVLDISKMLIDRLGTKVKLNITGNYRVGDIRHNVADISKAKSLLDFYPKVTLEKGLDQFVDWVIQQPIPSDRYSKSIEELKEKGLFK